MTQNLLETFKFRLVWLFKWRTKLIVKKSFSIKHFNFLYYILDSTYGLFENLYMYL